MCKAGVHSLAQDSKCKVQDGSFLHSVAVWVKHQILTSSLDMEGYINSTVENAVLIKFTSDLFIYLFIFLSFSVLVQAVRNIVETVVAYSGHDSPLLIHFLSELMPSQPQWCRIRQDLPLQVRK